MEEDEILQEIDVYISKDLTDLFLLQFPLRQDPVPDNELHARFKSQSELLELLMPIDTSSEFYSSAKDEIKSHVPNAGIWNQHVPGFQHLTSTRIQLESNYFAGFFKDEKFFLAPLKSCVQLRPSLRNFGLSATKEHDEFVDATHHPEKTKALQIQFRKKETQTEAVAKLKSYSYLQKLVNEESWSDFAFLSETSAESQDMRNVITLTSTTTIIPVSTTIGELISRSLHF